MTSPHGPGQDRSDHDREGPDEPSGPTIRDRRRIDPTTYQVREPAPPSDPPADQQPGEQAPGEQEPGDEPAAEADTVTDPVAELTAKLAERTEDLQRLQAEYVNYKRRVDRDRDQARLSAVQSVLRELLPVLDSIGQARDHDELNGGFKAVADELEKVTSRHGLQVYGEAGDAFDPHIHEALMHVPGTAELTGPTCVQVLQPGYRVGDRVLRAARVAVADPAPAEPAEPEPEAGDAEPDEA